MTKKPLRRPEYAEIVYDTRHWQLLNSFRAEAASIMEALARFDVPSIVHGSVARGDVNEKSDVDVFISEVYSSFLVETALDKAEIKAAKRFIVQATPSYVLKGYIEINPKLCVSFPLVKLRQHEREFYKFSGEATLQMLKDGKRVAGVDKRLMLIEPTTKGHEESSIVGREEAAANTLGVSLKTVMDRVRVLTRRDSIGRTGVFIEKELLPDESFELALKKLAEHNPAVRRRVNYDL